MINFLNKIFYLIFNISKKKKMNLLMIVLSVITVGVSLILSKLPKIKPVIQTQMIVVILLGFVVLTTIRYGITKFQKEKIQPGELE
jgi:hypothetical protein